jgi:hypothetical protein
LAQTALISAAWAAIKTRRSYLRAQFARLKGARAAAVAAGGVVDYPGYGTSWRRRVAWRRLIGTGSVRPRTITR